MHHEHATQEIEKNMHRFTFELECPVHSTARGRSLTEVTESSAPHRAVVCDHLGPLLGGSGHGFWPSGEPLTADMVAFAQVLGRYLLREPGSFDVVCGFCEHPVLPERICLCRTWGRCTDA